ncbi:MAG: phospholipid carrier-dependent glycosyltransferase, partial [Desulfobacterales bacterium]|nr:phospholipid carrier-dependent glycosyltransferase [Desulfobacterales bacterium]
MKKSFVAVIGFFLLLYILPLGVRPMTVPDEARYAEVPREMLASGDWVVPRLNGLRYFEKPALGYWANALSMTLFGQNAFAVRLPSALSAGASALAVFLMVLRFGSGVPAATLSAAVLLTSLEVFALGTFCVLDSPLSFFLTGGMVFFFFGFMEKYLGKRRLFLALSGLFFGLAFLTKGFLAFAVPLVSIVPFALWEKRGKDLLKCSWIPMAAVLLVASPWALMIHLREPDYWHYFFWTEHIQRFLSPEAQHGKPLWYFLGVFVGGALPWTFLIPATASNLWKAGRGLPLIRFSLCWLLFPFIFFSLSHGKLATYILPCFPPFAVLTGIGVMGYLEKGRHRAFVAGGTLLALMIGLIAFALLWLQLIGLSPLRPYHAGETWKWMAGAAGLLLWVLLLVPALFSRLPWKRLALFSVA